MLSELKSNDLADLSERWERNWCDYF